MAVPIVLVGGPLDQQVMMVDSDIEPRLKFRVRELDADRFVEALYAKADKPVVDFPEYEFLQEFQMDRRSLSATCEDLWLLEQFEPGYQGFGADIGAHNGVATSNTLLLERAGWTVLCVEPQPAIGAQLRMNRNLIEICACSDHDADSEPFQMHADAPGAYSALKPIKDHPIWHPLEGSRWQEIQVRVCRLDTLLKKHEFPRLDVLSVDTEGTELDVFQGIDLEKWQPKAVISECWDENGPVVQYLEAHGYRLVERREPNDLFLRA